MNLKHFYIHYSYTYYANLFFVDAVTIKEDRHVGHSGPAYQLYSEDCHL